MKKKSIGKIAVSAGDGNSGKEVTYRFIIDIAVEGADEKQENDCRDRTKCGNELVFRQGRNEDTDGNERAADKKNTDNATDIQRQIGFSVHRQGNIINCRRNDKE